MGRFHERFSAHARLSVDWVDSDHGNCESRFFLTILALLGNKNGKSKRNCLRIFPGPDCVVQARHLYENTNVALINLQLYPAHSVQPNPKVKTMMFRSKRSCRLHSAHHRDNPFRVNMAVSAELWNVFRPPTTAQTLRCANNNKKGLLQCCGSSSSWKEGEALIRSLPPSRSRSLQLISGSKTRFRPNRPAAADIQWIEDHDFGANRGPFEDALEEIVHC